MARLLLQYGADLRKGSQIPLIEAACRGLNQMVILLLDFDANINEIHDTLGRTALHLLVDSGQAETVRLLLE